MSEGDLYGGAVTRRVDLPYGAARVLDGPAASVHCQRPGCGVYGQPLSEQLIEGYLRGRVRSCAVCHAASMDPFVGLSRLEPSAPEIAGLAGARRSYIDLPNGPYDAAIRLADLVPAGAEVLDVDSEIGLSTDALRRWAARHPEYFPPGGGTVEVPDDEIDRPPWEDNQLTRGTASFVAGEGDASATHAFDAPIPDAIRLALAANATARITIVWLPSQPPNRTWQYLRLATSHVRRGETSPALVMANTAVELALRSFMDQFLEGLTGHNHVDRFLNSHATAAWQQRVLLPLAIRERALQAPPREITAGLQALRSARNRAAHGENVTTSPVELVRLLAVAVLGTHYYRAMLAAITEEPRAASLRE